MATEISPVEEMSGTDRLAAVTAVPVSAVNLLLKMVI